MFDESRCIQASPRHQPASAIECGGRPRCSPQLFDPEERRNPQSGPMVVDRCDDKGQPLLFLQTIRFGQSEWFGQSHRAWFRDCHDKRVPLEFSPNGLKVAGFGVSAAFSWENRHDKRFRFEFSQTVTESRILARFPLFLGKIAMINGFPFGFSQADGRLWHDRHHKKA